MIIINIKEQLFNLGIYKGKPIVDISDRLRMFYAGSIGKWSDIYSGEADWRYVSKGGLNGGTRRISCINTAKALCAELANLCFAQQVDFNIADKSVEQFIEKTLQENNFWSCFPLFLEKVFALGGGVIKVYAYKGKIRLDYIDCESFIPTQYDDKGIYGGMIISRQQQGKTGYILIENHEKTKTGYRISNRLFKTDLSYDNGVEIPLETIYPDLQQQTEIANIEKPLFVYFKPNSANNQASIPLGISVFANATDTLKNLDIIFDSLQREFILGKKRILVPTSAIRGEYDEKGNKHKYFDVNDEVYQAFSADDNDNLQITDNSTELRVEQHLTALEGLLDILCMQVGLSQGTLSYHSGTMRTATEVVSQNSKTYRTKTAHQQLIREGLASLAENIFLLGKALGQISSRAALNMSISFSDSVMQDNSVKIDNAVKLFDAGIITKEQALMEIYGLTKEEANRYGN